jgi:hypothetical protein
MFALTMFRLIAGTLIAGFACYGIGLFLRIFSPGYANFRYRLSLPIIACCFGSIVALLGMTVLMSYFLIDELYRVALVRQYPSLVIGTFEFAAYVLGGYYSTKYAVPIAHQLDARRNSKKNYQTLQIATAKSLRDVGSDLFRREKSLQNSDSQTKE